MQLKQPSCKDSPAFAEVVESMLTTITGQCWNGNDLPTFGSFVTIDGNPSQIGCVTDIRHLSRDPSRIPVTYQMTEEELRREQPQIFILLITQFTIKIIGYYEQQQIVFATPPLPANIHSFINRMRSTETNALLNNEELFEAIIQGDSNPLLDDLLLVLIRQLAQHGPIPTTILDHLYELYRHHTKGDVARCRRLFKRIDTGH